MNDKEQIPTQVVITQDKLVDLLLHAATREDIAKYAAESKADSLRVENSIPKVESSLRNAIL